jgi:hypothetical protein
MGIDFVTILEKREKGERVAYPEFTISHTDDLMIRGNAFYAIWDEKSGYWSTNEESVVNIVDNMLYEYKESH